MIQLVGCPVEMHLDGIVLCGDDNEIVAVSVYDSSQQSVASFCSKFIYDAEPKNEYSRASIVIGRERFWESSKRYSASYTEVRQNKRKFYQGLIVNDELGKSIIVTDKEREGLCCYQYLMENCDLPLLPEWGDALLAELIRMGEAQRVKLKVLYGEASYMKENPPYEGKSIIRMLRFIDNGTVTRAVTKLLKEGKIRISKKPQHVLSFANMDDYFEKYGTAVVENLERQLTPLSELNGEVDNVVLNSMRLYPQQATMVNGVVSLFDAPKGKNSRYCFLAEGMGVGKTIQASSIVEKHAVEKWLRANPGKTVKDAYSDKNAISYRVFVMAPGHMVKKWAKEIKKQVPYAKTIILTDFSQLIELRKRGKQRCGREFYVLSKDFAKLSYATQPVPSRMRYEAPVCEKICTSCGKTYNVPGDKCPKCGNKGYTLGTMECDECGFEFSSGNICPSCGHVGAHMIIDPIYKASGLMCPTCGNVLIPNQPISSRSVSNLNVLTPGDFENPKTTNDRCYWCGTPLWEPYVKNLTLPSFFDGREERREPSWTRITVYANAKQTTRKSIWAHKRYQKAEIDTSLAYKEDCSGVRKYAPARYIKKYLKGFIDYLIADEAHLYKGASGQGEAFAALSKVSKYTLALTGTITGGKAQDLFYTLFRLDPGRMLRAGFGIDDALKFSQAYGTVVEETRYDSSDDDIGVTTGNVRRSQPRVEPGISPKIFGDFLLDRAVFLDITDLSKYLPPLKETVVLIQPDEKEERIMGAYEGVIKQILTTIRRDKSESGLLGTMLQFSLSYLDKPYTVLTDKIIAPNSGLVVCDIPQYTEYKDVAVLTSKEKKLLEIVKSELKEKRNVFIYAEYTASEDTEVSTRIKAIVEEHLGERCEILKSSSPKPLEREEYIHRLALEGVKVFVTNPKCVETGLDFVWTEDDGTEYNFPTIIFYQMGYSLFTVSQASRRHYRLIQRRECRTYYMCWEKTAQQAAIGIIAAKMVAASAIQGKFSSDGIAAMAEGIDARILLAESLATKDMKSGADLQGMFDVLEEGRESSDDDSDYRPMPVLKELIGEELYEELTVEKRSSASDLISMLFNKPKEEKPKPSRESGTMTLSDFMSGF